MAEDFSDTATISNKYQKLKLRDHILKRPDTYIGSVSSELDKHWILNEKNNRTELCEINSVPGLYKIIDEIIVNARDQYIKLLEANDMDYLVENIYINVDKETGVISVQNDGKGIPNY